MYILSSDPDEVQKQEDFEWLRTVLSKKTLKNKTEDKQIRKEDQGG